jgi:hypothetical protein
MARQFAKAVYYSDYASDNDNKTFSIAFTVDEEKYYSKIAGLSSYELKRLLGCDTYAQLKTQAERDGRSVNQYAKRTIMQSLKSNNVPFFQIKDVTFLGGKNMPFQRWYPYIEGYSPSFVTSIIAKYCPDSKLIYDPFAGTGTTIFAADMLGIPTLYSEINPLLRFLIKTKLSVLRLSWTRRNAIGNFLRSVSQHIVSSIDRYLPSEDLDISYKDVFGSSVYFPQDQYHLLLRCRSYIDDVSKTDVLSADLITVAILSSLIPISLLKKQGDLRFKTEKEKKSEMRKLEDILPQQIKVVADDVVNFNFSLSSHHRATVSNAKLIGEAKINVKITDVITSPPYLNGTNYFRNTKLELWFIRQLKSEKDLRSFRDMALTSGINDVRQEYSSQLFSANSDLLNRTLEDLVSNAYDKRIPLMAKCYFNEMFKVFSGLSKQLAPGANIMIDIGDSIFSNVHIKTDIILTDILEGIGYYLKESIVLRQRRSRNGELLTQVLLVYRYQG